MTKNKGKIFIGTSGWHYKHWLKSFYPEKMGSKDFLSYYQHFFQTTEINNSFYRLPKNETFRFWKESVPEDFVFAVKANRYITHMKKLKDPHEALANFFQNVDALEDKMGPILFQLPPAWKVNVERFGSFVKNLPSGYRYTFEFRNHTWYTEEIYDILRKNNYAFCIYELEYHLSPVEITADFVYVRLHGPEKKYQGSYTDKALAWWANRIVEWTDGGKDVYCYFDNDQYGYAALNARTLNEMMEKVKA
jgi:uncharacterized protein YecE (DUF72 family)